MPSINQTTPQELQQWLKTGDAILIDVREPAEYRAEAIEASRNVPLSSVTVEHVFLPEHRDKKLVIHCKSGKRSMMACDKLKADNAPCDIWNLNGGIEAWKAANLPIKASGASILPLDRQVQLSIGLMILFGLALSYAGNGWGLILPLIAGVGLANAGLTGWCGLAKLMAKMPWNQ